MINVPIPLLKESPECLRTLWCHGLLSNIEHEFFNPFGFGRKKFSKNHQIHSPITNHVVAKATNFYKLDHRERSWTPTQHESLKQWRKHTLDQGGHGEEYENMIEKALEGKEDVEDGLIRLKRKKNTWILASSPSMYFPKTWSEALIMVRMFSNCSILTFLLKERAHTTLTPTFPKGGKKRRKKSLVNLSFLVRTKYNLPEESFSS